MMVGKKRKEGQSIRSFTPGKYLNLPRFLSNFNFSNGDMIHAENLRKGKPVASPFRPAFSKFSSRRCEGEESFSNFVPQEIQSRRIATAKSVHLWAAPQFFPRPLDEPPSSSPFLSTKSKKQLRRILAGSESPDYEASSSSRRNNQSETEGRKDVSKIGGGDWIFSRDLIDSSGLIVNKSCSSQRRKIEPFRDRFENWERKSGSFLPSSFSLSFQCFSLVEAHSKRRFSRVFVEGSLLAFKTKFIKRASDARSKIE